MPQIFKIAGYIVYFWSNENNEPIHVHISKGKPVGDSTKIWLTKSGNCIIANNKSNIPINDLKKILKVINDNYFLILSKWKNYFEGQEIKFYC